MVLPAQRSPGCLPPRGSRTTAPTSNAGPPAPAPPARSASAVTPQPRDHPSTIAVQVLGLAPTAPFTPLNLCVLLLFLEGSVSYFAQLEKGRAGRWRAVLLVTETKGPLRSGWGGEVQRRQVTPLIRGAILGNAQGSAEHVEPSSRVSVRNEKPRKVQESLSSELPEFLEGLHCEAEISRQKLASAYAWTLHLFLGQWPQRQPWGQA